MKLEDQVCDLQFSIKLEELGIKQSSIFVWEYIDDKCYGVKFRPYACVPSAFSHTKLYSAFTVSELLELLPAHIDIRENEPFNNFWLRVLNRNSPNIQYIVNYVCDSVPGEEISNPLFEIPCKYKTHGEKLADCLAEMLIILIEQGFV